MNVARAQPWTAEKFLVWAARQDGRYEFDGFQPVAMTGGTVRHTRIMGNLHAALRSRLRRPCAYYGPDLGVATVGSTIRYPDALISCAEQAETGRVATDVIATVEVVSPGSGRVDRIIKVAEYAAVPTILRYVVIETSSAGLLIFSRVSGRDPWTAHAATLQDVLPIPEVCVEIPVAELYEGVAFSG